MIPADRPLFLPSCHSYVRTVASIARFVSALMFMERGTPPVHTAVIIGRRAYLHSDYFRGCRQRAARFGQYVCLNPSETPVLLG
jgi:hypothetical protein